MPFCLQAAPRERENQNITTSFCKVLRTVFYVVGKNRKIEPAPAKVLAHGLTVCNMYFYVIIWRIELSMFSMVYTIIGNVHCDLPETVATWGKVLPEIGPTKPNAYAKRFCVFAGQMTADGFVFYPQARVALQTGDARPWLV